ncbi:protein kinase C-binding protein NELL1-like [Delphinapterus leucas]|uniref:Protein kinase C-binding protein NELL1-like n=1 Tax=Delphinapterus leucas TaxID=9749 RepID=A0A2Y9M7H6_DELLE|nr:protein kinase C-binding protein NELL1-like [Delphinapterus leucas]
MDNGQEGGLEPYHEELLGEPGGADCGQGQLNYAETRLSQLENCHCEKTCQVSGLLYRDQDSWVDGDHCRNCTCKSGAVECRRMSCPPLNCSPDSLPVHIAGQCCKVCRPKCIYGGKVLAEGQRILTKSCRECRTVWRVGAPDPRIVQGSTMMPNSMKNTEQVEGLESFEVGMDGLGKRLGGGHI